MLTTPSISKSRGGGGGRTKAAPCARSDPALLTPATRTVAPRLALGMDPDGQLPAFATAAAAATAGLPSAPPSLIPQDVDALALLVLVLATRRGDRPNMVGALVLVHLGQRDGRPVEVERRVGSVSTPLVSTAGMREAAGRRRRWASARDTSAAAAGRERAKVAGRVSPPGLDAPSGEDVVYEE